MMTMDERVALAIYDKLVADEVTADHAAAIAQQALREMPGRDELSVVKIVDSTGQPHASVMASPPASLLKLYRLDLRALREKARLEMIEELREDIEALDVDLALSSEGTRIAIGP